MVRAAVTAKLGLGVGAACAAALQLRALLATRPEPGLEARIWEWDDHAMAASSSTSATVLPWPAHRRPSSTVHDPDLPGGA